MLVPLAGSIVGGQHLLHGWQRPIGAILGALVTAALCLDSTQPSDNLSPGAVVAVVLAALAASAWRRMLAGPRWTAQLEVVEPIATAESLERRYFDPA